MCICYESILFYFPSFLLFSLSYLIAAFRANLFGLRIFLVTFVNFCIIFYTLMDNIYSIGFVSWIFSSVLSFVQVPVPQEVQNTHFRMKIEIIPILFTNSCGHMHHCESLSLGEIERVVYARRPVAWLIFKSTEIEVMTSWRRTQFPTEEVCMYVIQTWSATTILAAAIWATRCIICFLAPSTSALIKV